MTTETIVIRSAREADAHALKRLAELHGARLPEGDLLVAEIDGEIRAAMRIADRAVVADPFHFTPALVELLDTRAASLRRERMGRRERTRAAVDGWSAALVRRRRLVPML